jgi:hypothetical protein
MYNDERQLVPCSIAAPPSSFAANVHRQVTRGHQFAFDLICAALACPSSSPASCACACSCCKCVIANALSECWGPEFCAAASAHALGHGRLCWATIARSTVHFGHRHGHDQSEGRPSDEKLSRAPGLRVSTLAPYSPPLPVLTACCSMPCTASVCIGQRAIRPHPTAW